jgi:hypothetical protein
MGPPFGIDNEYRKSDEYKYLVKCVKDDYPDMPIYLIELALTVHKNDPQYYKTAMKAERLHLAQSVNKSLVQGCKEAQKTIDDYVLYNVTVSDPVQNNISEIINNDRHKTKEDLQDSNLLSEQIGPSKEAN